MNKIAEFKRTVALVYYSVNQRIKLGSPGSNKEMSQILTTAYRDPFNDTQRELNQILRETFQFLVHESDDHIDFYVDTLSKDAGICLNQFYKDIHAHSRKMMQNIIYNTVETNQAEKTEIYIKGILDYLLAQCEESMLQCSEIVAAATKIGSSYCLQCKGIEPNPFVDCQCIID